ncbi:MAG TPA: SUMF1/EgtB/PvdO family nonheme iron enzyme [Planctomycetota bacterium]
MKSIPLLLALALGGDDPWKVYGAWPFDAAEAARRQAETAKAMGVADPLKVGALTFRLVPAGAFELGSPKSEPGHEGDETLKPETIAEPFYMLETQLTVAHYRALMKADPPETGADPALPAALPYRDVMDQVLPALAKAAPQGWKPILPDRARLEYAARAGVATMNPGGAAEADADAYAWTQANSENRMRPVAQKKPNAWGLYDVIGNRWHWVWVGPTGGYGDLSTSNHLVYGGSYHTPPSGNGARLANIMVSGKPEGARFALIRESAPLPKGHPDTARK